MHSLIMGTWAQPKGLLREDYRMMNYDPSIGPAGGIEGSIDFHENNHLFKHFMIPFPTRSNLSKVNLSPNIIMAT